MSTGDITPCYFGQPFFNLYDDFNAPVPEKAIGRCCIAHCYNGHALLTLGVIPGKYPEKYGTIRDRLTIDGGHWLQPELMTFFNTKLEENNNKYSRFKEARLIYSPKVKHKLQKMFK